VRFPLAFLFCLAATAARAVSPGYPCPSFVAGWSLSGPGPITSISWDQQSQQMYFVWSNVVTPSTFICALGDENKVQPLALETGVPIRSETNVCTGVAPQSFVADYYPVASSSVMQTFSQSNNWTQTFDYLIKPSYHAVLLKEVDNCPVLQESYPIPCWLEDENGLFALASQTGSLLLAESYACVSAPGGFVWVN
jgi:hypothetical protein